MKKIEFEVSTIIDRPLVEVASQFADFRYHASREVHPGVRFFVHDVTAQRTRCRQEVTLVGMKQIDELENHVISAHEMRTDFIGGTNKGTSLHFHFIENGPSQTEIQALVTVPVSGVKALLKPVFELALRSLVAKALEEDKRDLEGLRYCHYLAGNN